MRHRLFGEPMYSACQPKLYVRPLKLCWHSNSMACGEPASVVEMKRSNSYLMYAILAAGAVCVANQYDVPKPPVMPPSPTVENLSALPSSEGLLTTVGGTGFPPPPPPQP